MKRIVVKVGSSTLAQSDSSIDYAYLDALVSQIAQAKERGYQIVLVSSGAIACGLGALGIETRPQDMPTLQAAASVGQSALSAAYADAFSRHSVLSSLVLLTRHDTSQRSAYLHARDTLCRLLELGVVPVVNENDTVSVEQIRFGDNDTLAALVACLVDADRLIILSDIDGLYDADPSKHEDAQLISKVAKIDEDILAYAGGAGSSVGSGGMKTKVLAARVLASAGIATVVTNGHGEDAVLRSLEDECPGTTFLPAVGMHEISPKKLWVALGDTVKGSLIVDDGARRALISSGSSLLPVGIEGVDGVFDEGDIVEICDVKGTTLGRGKALASSDVISLLRGKSGDEIAKNRLLSAMAHKPVIHRDDLLMFE